MFIPILTRGRTGIPCCQCPKYSPHRTVLCKTHAHFFLNANEEVKMAVEDTVAAYNDHHIEFATLCEKISKIFNGPPKPSRIDGLEKDMGDLERRFEERARQFEEQANSLIEEQAKINKKNEARLKRLEEFMEEQRTVQWQEQRQAQLENIAELQYYIDNPGAGYGSFRVGVLSLV